jgi:hypothetical protein
MKMMLIHQGKKMTYRPEVKKAFRTDAGLLNGRADEQRIARGTPQSRAACGVSKASLRQHLALALLPRDENGERGHGLQADWLAAGLRKLVNPFRGPLPAEATFRRLKVSSLSRAAWRIIACAYNREYEMTVILQSPYRRRLLSGSPKNGRMKCILTIRCCVFVTRAGICSGAKATLKNTLDLNKCFFTWALDARV